MESSTKHPKSVNSDRSVLNSVSPSPVPSSVEVVKPKDYKKAAKTLQIAFQHDPFINYLTKDCKSNSAKLKLIQALFEYSVHYCLLKGIVVAVRNTNDPLNDKSAPFLAVACWLKPNSKDHFWDIFLTGYFKVLRNSNKQTQKKIFDEQFPLLDEIRINILKDKDTKTWYLNDIGTIPLARGKGLAKTLIQYVVDNFVDPKKNYCYLESSNPINRIIYEKIGFTYVKTFTVAYENNQPIVLDAMIRNAAE